MSPRIDLTVVCSSCRREIPEHEAERRITAWVPVRSPKNGGTLSHVRNLSDTGERRCKRCALGTRPVQDGLAI